MSLKTRVEEHQNLPILCGVRITQILALFLAVVLGSSSLPEARGAAQEKVILALGDSLMAGYGLPSGVSFPAKLERWLRAQGIPVRIINGGVSGDTSTGGRERLEWSLDAFDSDTPDLVILEFGANDMLRGIEPSLTRDNLTTMLDELKRRRILAVLFGMRAAPNLGIQYTKEFNAIYSDLAKRHKVELVPFYLEGVAGNRALNLEDGIHPNEPGLDVMVKNIGPKILTILQRQTAKP